MMTNLNIQYNEQVEEKQLSPNTSIKEFKLFLLNEFPQLKEQIRISAKIKSTKMDIDLYNDENAKLVEKYQLTNNETIILIKVVTRQSLIAAQKKASQQYVSPVTPNSKTLFQFPKECQNCLNYQEELKKKQIEIESLQILLQKEHLPTIKTQNYMQNSSENFFHTQNQSQIQSQTQSVFYKTQAESLQGKLLVEDLEKMLKQLYLSEIDQLKQRIKDKDFETDKLKQNYEKLMKDTNDLFSLFKSQMIQDKEQQRQFDQRRIEEQTNEINRLKEQVLIQSKNVIKYKELVQKMLD